MCWCLLHKLRDVLELLRSWPSVLCTSCVRAYCLKPGGTSRAAARGARRREERRGQRRCILCLGVAFSRRTPRAPRPPHLAPVRHDPRSRPSSTLHRPPPLCSGGGGTSPCAVVLLRQPPPPIHLAHQIEKSGEEPYRRLMEVRGGWTREGGDGGGRVMRLRGLGEKFRVSGYHGRGEDGIGCSARGGDWPNPRAHGRGSAGD